MTKLKVTEFNVYFNCYTSVLLEQSNTFFKFKDTNVSVYKPGDTNVKKLPVNVCLYSVCLYHFEAVRILNSTLLTVRLLHVLKM